MTSLRPLKNPLNPSITNLPEDWKNALQPLLTEEACQRLVSFLDICYREGEETLPTRENLFLALRLSPLAKTKVVILGQDPYPNPGHAHGLAFSVLPPHPIAASLRNIFKELQADIGSSILTDSNLTPWAEQGVLLLNTILTVRAHASLSHAKQGWEPFTDAVIRCVSEQCAHVVFILWGAKAQSKIALIDTSKHCILTSAHPSPLSARNGFFGSQPFSKANAWLASHHLLPIRW